MEELEKLLNEYKSTIYESQAAIQTYIGSTKQKVRVPQDAVDQLNKLKRTLIEACAYILTQEKFEANPGLEPVPDTTRPPEVQIVVESERLSKLLVYFSRLIQLYQASFLNPRIPADERRAIAQEIADREWEAEASIHLLSRYNIEASPEPVSSGIPPFGTPGYIPPIYEKLDKIIRLLTLK